MKTIFEKLRELGHRVCAYLEDFFGAAQPFNSTQGTAEDRKDLGKLMNSIFASLSLHLHPSRTTFDGGTQIKILGILFYYKWYGLIHSPAKLRAISAAACQIRRYALNHQRSIAPKLVRRFADLANSISVAIFDASLRLQELFDLLKTAADSPALRYLYAEMVPFLPPDRPIN